MVWVFFFFSSRRRHTRLVSDWSSDVCSSDLEPSASFDGDIESVTLDILHDHIDGAIRGGAKIVDGDCVGMTKTTRCLALTSKSSQPLGIRSDFGRKNFDGNAVAEQDVASAINCSHSTFAEQRFHLVLAVEHGIDDGSRIGLEHLAI